MSDLKKFPAAIGLLKFRIGRDIYLEGLREQVLNGMSREAFEAEVAMFLGELNKAVEAHKKGIGK